MPKFYFSERDLDLLQLEELHAESGYAAWFANRVGLSGYRFISARHSVSATVNGFNGETDLLVFFEKHDSKVAVLIEDKISAAFTHRQAERYVERGEDLVLNGASEAFKTVLVAPKTYLSSVPPTHPWHEKISVEEIASWFEAQSGHHFRWRFEALTEVVDKIARNLLSSSDEVVLFSRKLSNYIERKHAPNLVHTPGKDRNGPTIRFPGSNPRLQLWWKFATNQMVLHMGEGYQGLAKRLELPSGIELELGQDWNRSSDYLVAPIQPVDLSEPFETQLATVDDALDKAILLTSVVPRVLAVRTSIS